MNAPFVLNVTNTNEPPPPVTHNRAISSYATKTFSHAHRPTAGPSLDIGLTRGFSVSLSGVYQPIRYVVNHQNTVIIRARRFSLNCSDERVGQAEVAI